MSDDRKVFSYPGKKMDVAWDGRLCIHVGECTRASGELFVGGRNPWCQPDLAEVVVLSLERRPQGREEVRLEALDDLDRSTAPGTITKE